MKPIVVRGGGDLATGVIHRLSKSGYSVIVLETDKPSAIRRLVAFSEAVENGSACVEGITCVCVNSVKEALKEAKPLHPVLLVDPKGESIPLLKPEILIDAIIAKKNLGTTRKMAPLTIALGPGFEAGKDVGVLATLRSGRVYRRCTRRGSRTRCAGLRQASRCCTTPCRCKWCRVCFWLPAPRCAVRTRIRSWLRAVPAVL